MNPIIEITKRMRAGEILKFIEAKPSHLDIGCGNCFLLQKSPCKQKVGLEKKTVRITRNIEGANIKLIKHKVEKILPFDDNSFDYVTMAAVLEHLDYPKEILNECLRVLKPGGLVILTTPKASSERLIKLYGSGKEHKHYFEPKDFIKMGFEENLVSSRRFAFGLNQLFVLTKKSRVSR